MFNAVLHFILMNILIFGLSDYKIESNKSNSSTSNDNHYKRIFQCENASEKSIVIHGIYSWYEDEKESLTEKRTLLVYLNCLKPESTFNKTPGTYLQFMKLCGKNQTYFVDDDMLLKNENSITNENIPLMYITLRISNSTKKLILKLQQCDARNQIKIQHKSNKSISGYESISLDMPPNNITNIIINLSVINSQNQIIAEINFTLEKWPESYQQYRDSFKNFHEELEYSNIMENIDEYMNESNLDIKIQKFADLLEELTTNTSLKETLSYKMKDNILFRLMISFKYILEELTNLKVINKKAFTMDNKSLFIYLGILNQSLSKFEIPLNESQGVNKTQFVELLVHDKDENRVIVTSFFLLRDINNLTRNENLSNDAEIFFSETDQVYRFANSDIFDLKIDHKRNVTVKFKMRKNIEKFQKSWSYTLKDECSYLKTPGKLEWAVDGCTQKSNEYGEYCECHHLSNFAVVVAMKVHENHITITRYMSIIGGVINIISLFLFILFVLVINSRDKMRLDQLNIAICLLSGTFVFLIGGLMINRAILCILVALFSQFMFLSAFMWKLLLGINAFRVIVLLKYQREDWLIKFRIAAIVTCYTIPLVIVIISGSIFWEFYGPVYEHRTCWIDSNDLAFYIFYVPIGIIIGINLLTFLAIAIALVRNYINTRKTRVNESNELWIFIQIFVSMGLTWLPSYFARTSLTAIYMFLIFFPLQGLLMFLSVVVINKENRNKVSSFISAKYLSLTSKSSSSEGKSHSKSKTHFHSLETEQDISLMPKIKQEDDRSAICDKI